MTDDELACKRCCGVAGTGEDCVRVQVGGWFHYYPCWKATLKEAMREGRSTIDLLEVD
jgi:hypothetical protein